MVELATFVPLTTAEGPGRRFAIWVQGCALRCPECCNPGMLAHGRGQSITVSTLLAEIDRAIEDHGIEGITVLGGEPLEQIPALTALCRGAAERELGVLIFSGFRLAEAMERPGFPGLWEHVDTLVDGRYDGTCPEPPPEEDGRRFIGSSNQVLRHRTDRYRDPAHWRGEARLEVYLDDEGGMSAHGEPRAIAELLRGLRP